MVNTLFKVLDCGQGCIGSFVSRRNATTHSRFEIMEASFCCLSTCKSVVDNILSEVNYGGGSEPVAVVIEENESATWGQRAVDDAFQCSEGSVFRGRRAVD
jgi:hypothetical protein